MALTAETSTRSTSDPSSATGTRSNGTPVLSLSGLSKSFPGVKALSDVHLDVYPASVLALIGENGAGKSTLVKILTGVYTPDTGTIEVDGRPIVLTGTQDAWSAGITAIHQETVMFDELSVTENIYMGRPILRSGGLLDWAAMRRQTAAILERLEIPVSPDDQIKNLSVAQRHLVEIARALSHDARVVIMDEPTAALSQREIDDLYAIIHRLKAEGKAVVFISHKFDEIFAIADRYAVLRDGQYIGDGAVQDTDQNALVTMMVGRSLDSVFPKVTVPIGDVTMSVSGARNATEFADIDFTLRRGEILGFYGLIGAGRSELMRALVGANAMTGGTVTIGGQTVRIRSPRDAIRAGLVYVPEDRQTAGAVLPMSIKDNITLPLLRRITGSLLLNRRKELDVTRRYGERLSIRAASWAQPVETLSGGNQQKTVIAKWLATRPDIIILDEPTKGIDVGSKAAVHEFMGELAGDGLAIILVSSELPEVLGMADRVIVMHEGRITGEFDRADATPAALVTAATGNRPAPSSRSGGEA
ncbi:sugar ABC transporter ATP-binding protein [Fodinicurvata sp. EGI_FJ10296]|uniref:sugar ABC transporter ATP-binding protein n=1 Tax=Fodinicurvata sp. EGI_FJ10296 TaxID=3231908 RepID=UPI003453B133